MPQCKLQPLLLSSMCVYFQPDDSFIVGGMSDGLVQFLHRKEPQTEEEKRAEMLSKPRFGYMRYMEFKPSAGDLVLAQVRKLANRLGHQC